MHSFLVLVIFQITVSFGLLLNNVDISDLERIKQEIKAELTKEFDLKLAEIKKNATTSLPNVRKYLNLELENATIPKVIIL